MCLQHGNNPKADTDTRKYQGLLRKEAKGVLVVKLFEVGAIIGDGYNLIVVPCVTALIVGCRALYYGKKTKLAVLIEALLFAIASRVMLPVGIDVGIRCGLTPQSAFDYSFLACITVGFLGIETVSEFLKKWANK